MLKVKNLSDKKMPMDSQTFVSILKSTGFDENTMHNLHVQFEKNSPDSHQLFLEFMGIEDEEIKKIRELGRVEEIK
jgi:predicted RNA binding protein YcfA (HicA-like mRNA interferase family)